MSELILGNKCWKKDFERKQRFEFGFRSLESDSCMGVNSFCDFKKKVEEGRF